MNASPYCPARDECIESNCSDECLDEVNALFACRADNWFEHVDIRCNLCSGETTRSVISGATLSKSPSMNKIDEKQEVFYMPMLSVQDQKLFWAEKAGVDKDTVDKWISDEDLEQIQVKVK